MIWFTSDTHFGHRKLLTFASVERNNPRSVFPSIEEHDAHLMKMWREQVQPEDTVYHLGDTSWYGVEKTNDLFNSLPGTKFLIKGNHDHKASKLTCFASVRDYYVLKAEDRRFILFHFPIEEWDQKHYGAIHLHGHCHSNSSFVKGRKDIGVDCHPRFGLFSLKEVKYEPTER